MSRPRRDLLADAPYRTSSPIIVGIGWRSSRGALPDVHATCVAVGGRGKLRGAVHPDWMTTALGGSLSWTDRELRGDRSAGDVEQVYVELAALPRDVDALVVGVTSSGGLDRLDRLHLRLVEASAMSSELARLDLEGPLRRDGHLLAVAVRLGPLWAFSGIDEPARVSRTKQLAKASAAWWKDHRGRLQATPA